MTAWLMLAGAVAAEVIATLALRSSAETFRPLTTVLVIAGYGTAFALMGGALRTLNVGIVYAVWSGVGTAAVAIAAAFLFGEHLNLTAIAGMALVVIGVVLMAFSGATTHA